MVGWRAIVAIAGHLHVPHWSANSSLVIPLVITATDDFQVDLSIITCSSIRLPGPVGKASEASKPRRGREHIRQFHVPRRLYRECAFTDDIAAHTVVSGPRLQCRPAPPALCYWHRLAEARLI